MKDSNTSQRIQYLNIMYTIHTLNMYIICTHMYCTHANEDALPVTPAQLMRPGIGRNASCILGDC